MPGDHRRLTGGMSGQVEMWQSHLHPAPGGLRGEQEKKR